MCFDILLLGHYVFLGGDPPGVKDYYVFFSYSSLYL